MPVSFSVIIPTYNRETWIENTLRSVFEQTYPHFEIIVVDDCSTDNTEKVLLPFVNAGKIKYLKHDRNRERAQARNTGMENATGDFVTFLDSDDFMLPNNLADAADFIAKNPELKCFQSLVQVIDTKGNFLYNANYPPIDNHLKAISAGNFMSCVGDFIHREIHTKYRFDVSRRLAIAEDWDFWLRVLADYKPARLEKINNSVTQHTGRTVSSIKLESAEECLRYVMDKVKADLHLSKVYAPYLKFMEANCFLFLAGLAIADQNFRQTRKYAHRALKIDFKTAFSSSLIKLYGRSLLQIKNKKF